MTMKAKVRGKGDREVHDYFQSQRYPETLHRVCEPEGRLYPSGMLRLKPTGNPHGWRRECPNCLKVIQTWEENPLLGAL